MAIHPISYTNFANKRFLRIKNYAFASKDAVVALVARELPKAAISLPTAFVAQGEGYTPVAVLGVQPGKNLFVRSDGLWVGGYIPAPFRGFPFLLGNAEDGRQVLCIDDRDGSVSESEGEAFFGEDQQPTKAVKDILNFLTQVAANRLATNEIMAQLQKHKLIVPWQIKVQNADKPGFEITGLYRIDEQALNKLSARAIRELQQSGALQLAYCHLLSMQHLPLLGKLAQAHQQAEQMAALPKTETGELDMSFLADDTTISFEDL